VPDTLSLGKRCVGMFGSDAKEEMTLAERDPKGFPQTIAVLPYRATALRANILLQQKTRLRASHCAGSGKSIQ